MTRTPNENFSDSNSKDDARKTSKNPVKYRKGKITRNPFLNFLRDIRKNAQGLTITDIAVKGAGLWRKMDPKDKKVYQDQARSVPQKPRKRRRRKNLDKLESSKSYVRSISRSKNKSRY